MPCYEVVHNLDVPLGSTALAQAIKKQGYIRCKALGKPPLSDKHEYIHLV